MRIQGVAIVRNEADIIESFVRHHSRLLDVLWVIDNLSSDETPRILESLRSEGLPLHVSQEARTPIHQQEVMSEILADWNQDCDWLFLLDADEFIDCPTRGDLASILTELDEDTCHLVPWSYMVPTPADDPNEDDPLRRIRHRRDAPTPHYLAKILLPRRLLGRGDITVSPGNHQLTGAGDIQHSAVESLRLAHFPLRSIGQMARKAVLGAWTASSRVERRVGQSHHWRQLRDRVLSGQGATPAQLQLAAANYAEPFPWTDWPLVEEPISAMPVEPLRYRSPERDWRHYAVEYADAHFRQLDVQILDQPLLLKTAQGVVGVQPGEEADVLRAYGDFAPQLVDLVACLADPDAVVVHDQPGSGYATLGLARLGVNLYVIPDADEDWLLMNLILSRTRDRVHLGPPSGEADVLVAYGPTAAARRMLLLGPRAQPQVGYLALPLRIAVEPPRDLNTGREVVRSRPGLPALLALRPDDPLFGDLAAFISTKPNEAHRWEAKQVIETLMQRRRMRRYKRQNGAKPMTDLERRLALEEQLRVDSVVLDMVLAGRFQEVRHYLRKLQDDLPETAIEQLELQLRYEAVRCGAAASAVCPDAPVAPRPFDPARASSILDDMAGPISPLRGLADFDPVSRVYRKDAGDRNHLLDHPKAATLTLSELRDTGLYALACRRLNGPVVITLETALTHPVASSSGLGVAINRGGDYSIVEPDDEAMPNSSLTLWFFPAAEPPPYQSAILV